MRLVDADALREVLMRELGNRSMQGFGKGLLLANSCIIHAPTIEPELTWHECFEDDPASFPDDERMVLMSFSNFPTPAVGWFERDDEGGYWTDGGQKTLVEYGLFVDGWWELPKKPEGRDK